MILVWRGWGIVVPVVVFLSALLAQMISTKLAGNGYWAHHGYPLSMALLIAGGLIWLADRFLYRNPGRITVDEKTGERFRWVPLHDFFFVRLRWWSLPCLGAAVVVLILK